MADCGPCRVHRHARGADERRATAQQEGSRQRRGGRPASAAQEFQRSRRRAPHAAHRGDAQADGCGGAGYAGLLLSRSAEAGVPAAAQERQGGRGRRVCQQQRRPSADQALQCGLPLSEACHGGRLGRPRPSDTALLLRTAAPLRPAGSRSPHPHPRPACPEPGATSHALPRPWQEHLDGPAGKATVTPEARLAWLEQRRQQKLGEAQRPEAWLSASFVAQVHCRPVGRPTARLVRVAGPGAERPAA